MGNPGFLCGEYESCEDRDYAELIFDCLLEEGNDKYDELSDAQFKKLIRKQYKYIKDVASEGFM